MLCFCVLLKEKFMKKRQLKSYVLLIIGVPLAVSSLAYAAKPINLSQQPASILQSFLAPSVTARASHIEEIKRHVDFNQTLHIRLQQTYNGFPIFGADAVLH